MSFFSSMAPDVPFSDDVPSSSLSTLLSDEASFAQMLTAIRRHLHRNPEVGMQEKGTSLFIRETLEQYGLDVQGPVAETGLYVDIDGRLPGGHVGYRADIDALPTQDAKQVGYRSRHDGVAHLCGHDAHTAVGIGVALLLHRRRADLRGRVRVFFQPNEEGLPSGAPRMIEDGVLDGLDAVYAIHVDPSLGVGRYGLMSGPVTAASDRFDVIVNQEGSGHSARPHEAVDTVWVATQIVNSFYQLIGRVTDARNATVLTICRFFAGQAHNVIPDRVEFGGTLRTTSTEDRNFLRQKLARAAEQIAVMHGASARFEYEQGAPPVINSPVLIQNVASIIQAAFGDHAIYSIPRASMGGEDFAHYLKHVPGALIRVGTASSPETSRPLHDDRFDIDETPLAPTAKLMAEVIQTHLDRRLTDDAIANEAVNP
jgi:amidohydrolase